MTRFETLEETLLRSFATRVVEHGFNRVEQDFQRAYDWGRAAFHLSFIEHDVGFDITADVALRFGELEELIQKDNKLLSATEKKNTFSMGSELGNLVDREPIRWTVTSKVELRAWPARFYNALKTQRCRT